MPDLNSLIQSFYGYFQKKYGMDTGNLDPAVCFSRLRNWPLISPSVISNCSRGTRRLTRRLRCNAVPTS